jgi:hypothetical protein
MPQFGGGTLGAISQMNRWEREENPQGLKPAFLWL